MNHVMDLEPNGDDDTLSEGRYVTQVMPAVNAEAPAITEAAEWIRRGELVAFPTETVYGLGADGLNEEAVAKIFAAKGRPQDNPLILHIATLDMLDPLVKEIRPAHYSALQRLWPGPITFIFEKSDRVPDRVTAGGSTVAVRMPTNEVARSLIAQAETPIAAPSANRSGRPSPTTAFDVFEDMNGRIPLILNGGACDIGVESTVVDLTEDTAVILRPGYYPPSMLENFFPDVHLDPALTLATGKAQDPEKMPTLPEAPIAPPKSPGMKYRHYAPRAQVTIYLGAEEAVKSRMISDFHTQSADGKTVGFMVFEKAAQELSLLLSPKQAIVRSLGKEGRFDTMGQRIFRLMRELDRHHCDAIFVQGVEPVGYGIAIMNRLMKAAGGNCIHVS